MEDQSTREAEDEKRYARLEKERANLDSRVNRDDEKHRALVFAGLALKEKYVYFQLASAGACIGFASTQMKDEVLSWLTTPLWMALALWGWSFFSGCRYISIRGDAMEAEVLNQRIKARANYGYRAKPGESKAVRDTIYLTASASRKHYRRQLFFLLAGAFLFVVWQFLRMLSRSLSVV